MSGGNFGLTWEHLLCLIPNLLESILSRDCRIKERVIPREKRLGMFLKKIHIVMFLFVAVFFAGCVTSSKLGLDSAKKTNQLRPGMAYEEVVSLLGEPKSSQMVEGKWIVRWSLHQMWKGWVPYDMVFDPKKKTLVSWAANETAYEKSQKRLEKIAKSIMPGSAGATATGPNDPQLMQQMAGKYYSFSSAGLGYSGGTERKVTLCPNGKYYDSSESSYSGGAGTSNAWGTAGQGSGGGTWRIQGTTQAGTITMVSANGEATNYKYRSCGSGCVYFGNIKFGYAGRANCQ